MAVLYITEYANVGKSNGPMPVPLTPEMAVQTVAIGGSSTQSAAFNNATQFVRLHADAICSVKLGTNPTATATTSRMAAGQTEYFWLDRANSGYKVAVITNT